MQSKSEQKRVETQQDALGAAKKLEDKYRYYCERCTGVAFKSVEKKAPTVPEGKTLACVTCLKPVLLPIKVENFILL